MPPKGRAYMARHHVTIRTLGQGPRGYLVLLAAPALLLALGTIVLQQCFRAALRCLPLVLRCPAVWQTGWTWLAAGAMGIAGGAVLVTVARLLVLRRWLHRMTAPAMPDLTAQVAALAARMQVHAPRVRLWCGQRPFAAISGVIRPTLVISPWMLDHLDPQEREAVLAHELAHVQRRDELFAWLALWLRDAFCYLPLSRRLYQHLRHDQELACDDLAVTITRRPLALASALAKVWQQAVTPPAGMPVMTLTGIGTALSERITRLMQGAPPLLMAPPSVEVRRARSLYGMVFLSLFGCGLMAGLGVIASLLK